MTGKMWGKTPNEIAALCKPVPVDVPALDGEPPMRGRAWVIIALASALWLALIGLGYLIGKFW